MVEHVRNTEDWIRAIERRLTATQRRVGSIPAGVLTDVRGELSAADNRQPAAPVEITYQTALYTAAQSGQTMARLMVDFPDVVKATDGTDIEILEYELWGRDDTTNALEATTSAVAGLAAPGVTFPGLAATPENKEKAAAGAGPWVRLDVSSVSSMRVDALIPGAVWSFRVRALGTLQKKPGLWSPEFQTQLDEDTTPPPQPTAPVLTASRGTITVRWDGLAVTGSMPSDFSHLIVAYGSSSSPINEEVRFFRGGGTTVISDADYYTPQFVRFRAVDLAGNASPWSEQSVEYTAPLVDEDVILSEIDANKTIIRNISTVALDEDLRSTIDQANTDATLALGAVAEQSDRIDNQVLPAISDAAASPVTNERLISGSLTVWPFKPETIPAGALAPGAVGTNELADFSVAVTKLKSTRHHIY